MPKNSQNKKQKEMNYPALSGRGGVPFGDHFGASSFAGSKIKQKLPFFVICDNIRSLENIGSIFRTADALNVNKIFLCGICGKPPHQKISKSALGAEKWINWEYHTFGWKLVEKLKRDKVFVAALEQTKKSLLYTKFKPEFPLALVVGNEVKGVSPSILKRVDKIIYLPMFGKKESLNVAVSFGITAYEINKARILPS